jgi:hypothetical protein
MGYLEYRLFIPQGPGEPQSIIEWANLTIGKLDMGELQSGLLSYLRAAGTCQAPQLMVSNLDAELYRDIEFSRIFRASPATPVNLAIGLDRALCAGILGSSSSMPS